MNYPHRPVGGGLLSSVLSSSLAGALLLAAQSAKAEVTLAEGDGWELYTQGRVGAFVSYARGEGSPRVWDQNNNIVELRPGGLTGEDAIPEREIDPVTMRPTQGTIESMRVRSGFVANTFGFGVRKALTDTTTMTAYLMLSTVIESEARRKYRPLIPDAREGYIRFEGNWGRFTAGRALTLFSRGATEITYLYGYAYGLGFPGSIDNQGPAAGHIGFGVLANGFAAGVAYATPSLAGFKLEVGFYDPTQLPGTRWERTKWLRPEAELTYDLKIGATANIHLFANGGWQKVYAANATDEATAAGAGYGGRFEVGPVRLGVAGHYGTGLGLNYALEASPATAGDASRDYKLRTFDGYYAQAMLVFGRLNISAGYGANRIHQLDEDKFDVEDHDMDPTTPTANDDPDPTLQDTIGYSIIRSQTGISAGVVYHLRDNLHLALDYFRSRHQWYIGATQTVNFVNAGMTLDW